MPGRDVMVVDTAELERLEQLARDPADRLYLRPLGPFFGPTGHAGCQTLGVEVTLRGRCQSRRSTTVSSGLADWTPPEHLGRQLERQRQALSRPGQATRRLTRDGRMPDRPLVMGIVNVTPDSFSDGGRFLDPAAAIAQGRALREAGADILDIGGESTRPGAAPVSAEEEGARILPVVEALAGDGAVVSVDTRHARTIEAAAKAGAALINDVWALAGDPAGDALAAAAATGLPVVLMHMQGTPATMQADPRYDDVVLDVYDWLAARRDAAAAAGIPADRIIVDPGIGFGKTLQHNLALLDQLAVFHSLGAPILVGASRKSFIAKAGRGEPADSRLAGSLAAGLAAVDRGAQILRVHDVAETVQALAVARAIAEA